MSSLTIIHGPMFAGKTTRLIAHLMRAKAAGQQIRAFKHARDQRYHQTHLATHDGTRLAALAVDDPARITEDVWTGSTVGIDEIHFFGDAIVQTVDDLLSRDCAIIAAGVNTDAHGKPFAPFPALLPRADDVILLAAPCAVCQRPAYFTQRMISSTELYAVGGSGDYEARCEEHFMPQSHRR